jgi:LAO/AO transport system kinase
MSLADEILAGNVRAAARLLRDIEDDAASARDELKKLYPSTGKAYVIGVTGAPGVGKSTLVDKMIQFLRKDSRDIAVIAVDPTSPFGGGALLGDRIRMQRHAVDPGVFIRSFATRGRLGGLSSATYDAVKVMEALGKDVILVETVGVGQDEVDIVTTADTSIVVLVPGFGDQIQTFKSGVLEIADIFVINKSTQNGADQLEMDLRFMLDTSLPRSREWIPPICRTEATTSDGVGELMDAIRRHREILETTDVRRQQKREQIRAEFVEILRSSVMREIMAHLDRESIEHIVDDLVTKADDPYTAADRILRDVISRGIS